MEKLDEIIEEAFERKDLKAADILVEFRREFLRVRKEHMDNLKQFTELLNSISLGKVMQNAQKKMD